MATNRVLGQQLRIGVGCQDLPAVRVGDGRELEVMVVAAQCDALSAQRLSLRKLRQVARERQHVGPWARRVQLDRRKNASNHFELDIAWAVAAGVDLLALLRKHAGRFRQMHIKDVTPLAPTNFRLHVETTEVGRSRLDWKRLPPAAYDVGVRQFYVEQEPPYLMDRFDAAAKSYACLSTQV